MQITVSASVVHSVLHIIAPNKKITIKHYIYSCRFTSCMLVMM